MQNLRQDLVFGVRTWRKRPILTLVTVLALAFGIAATSLAFAVLNAFFLRPLPVRDPDRIVRIYSSYTQGFQHFTVSYADLADIRDLTSVFAGVVAEQPVPFSLSTSGAAERVYGHIVSGGYFSILGVQPALGRFFAHDEEDGGRSPCVAVLGYEIWRRRFGGDPAIAGKTILLNGGACEVIGVAPKGFAGITTGIRPEIWRAARRDRTIGRGHREFFVAARLRPKVGVEQARAALDLLARQLQQRYPDTNSGIGFPVIAESDSRVHPLVRGDFLGASGGFLAIGGGVLALACANVAGIMLVAALARRREIGVRLAVGASRGRVLRQLVTEAALLAAAAGAIGLALAWSGTRLAGSIDVPTRIPIVFDIALDGRVLAFSAAAVAATILLFGLAPALQLMQVDLLAMLRNERPRGARPSRLRAALVALQVALAMALLMAGGMFLRSLANAERIDPGFDPDGVVAVSVDPGLHGYDTDALARFWTRLVPELESRPRVASVSLASAVPFELNITRVSLAPGGYQPTEQSGWPSIDWAAVSNGYFRTLRIPFVEGRDFTQSDEDAVPPAAIVNDVLARQFWPGSSATGRRLVTSSGSTYQVIGVVRANRFLTIGEPLRPQVFFPFPRSATAATILLRTSGDEPSALGEVRASVARLDATLPLYNAATMNDRVRAALLPATAAAVSAAAIALIALLLIGLGLYGSVAHVVSGREHEIGIRRALGARSRDVLWLVLRQAAATSAIGAVAGFSAGLAAVRLLRTLVYDVGPADPLVTAAAPLLLLVACGAVATIPALAALRVDPARALRSE